MPNLHISVGYRTERFDISIGNRNSLIEPKNVRCFDNHIDNFDKQ